MKNKGFTLLEMIFVLSILSMVILDIARWNAQETNQIAAKREGAHWFQLHNAVKKFMSDNQHIPSATDTVIDNGVLAYDITDIRRLKSKVCTDDPDEKDFYGREPYLPCDFMATTPLFNYQYHIRLTRTPNNTRKATIRLFPAIKDLNDPGFVLLDYGMPLMSDGEIKLDLISTATLTATALNYASNPANLLANANIQMNVTQPSGPDDTQNFLSYGTVLTSISSDAELDVFLRLDGYNDMESAFVFDSNLSPKQQTIKNLTRLTSLNTCNPTVLTPYPDQDDCSQLSNNNALVIGDQMFPTDLIDMSALPENISQLVDNHGKIKEVYVKLVTDDDGNLKSLFDGMVQWKNSAKKEMQIAYILTRAMLAKQYAGNLLNSKVIFDSKTKIFNELAVIGQVAASRYLDIDDAAFGYDSSGESIVNIFRTNAILSLKKDSMGRPYVLDPAGDSRLKKIQTESIQDDTPSNDPDYWKRFVIDPSKITNLNALGANIICDIDSLDQLPVDQDLLSIGNHGIVNGVQYDANGNVIASKCTSRKLDPSGTSVVQDLIVEGDLEVQSTNSRLIMQASKTYFEDMKSYAVADDPGVLLSMIQPTYVNESTHVKHHGEKIYPPADCNKILAQPEPGKVRPLLILIPQQHMSNVLETASAATTLHKAGLMDFVVSAEAIISTDIIGIDNKDKEQDYWTIQVSSSVRKGQYYRPLDSIHDQALCMDDLGCQEAAVNVSILAMLFCDYN